MPTAWFLMPYLPEAMGDGTFCRSLAINLDPVVLAKYLADEQLGGRLQEATCLGNNAVVKVLASAATLQAIAGLPGTDRLPVSHIDDPLSSLTGPQKTALRNRVLGLGYTAGEITARFGADLGQYTLRDVLRFILRRRRDVFTTDGVTITETSTPVTQRDDILIDRLDRLVGEP